MSKDVAELAYHKIGYVDLYYNDMHCLSTSFEIMDIGLPKPCRDAAISANPFYEVFLPLYSMAIERRKVSVNPQRHECLWIFSEYFPEISSEKGLNWA